jgi:hypothetical protein
MNRGSAGFRRGTAAAVAVVLSIAVARGAAAPSSPAVTPAAPAGVSAPTGQTPAPQGAIPETSAAQSKTLLAGAAVAILGKKVSDASGKDMGLVVDVLVNASGVPVAGVVDVGGFLGVGSRKIAIDWSLFQFRPDDANQPIVLALDRARVQAAPEYKPSARQPVPIVAAPPSSGSEPAQEK